MRAVFESLAVIEDRVLWALVAMIVAYLGWGIAAGVRGRKRAQASSAEAAPPRESSKS